jgi:hypothetical protein
MNFVGHFLLEVRIGCVELVSGSRVPLTTKCARRGTLEWTILLGYLVVFVAIPLILLQRTWKDFHS